MKKSKLSGKVLNHYLNLIKFSKDKNYLIAHIAGASGVGKSTLLEKFKNVYGDKIELLDLDDIDEYATKYLNKPIDYKSTGEQDISKLIYNIHKNIRQPKLNSTIKNFKKPAIIFGIHTEAETEYLFKPLYRIFINRPKQNVITDRLERDFKYLKSENIYSGTLNEFKEKFKNQYTEEYDSEIKNLKTLGYTEYTIDSAFKFIADILNKDFKIKNN